MNGKQGVTECAFVKSDQAPASYFANPVLLGKGGVEKNLGMGELSDFEKKKLEEVRVYFYLPQCQNSSFCLTTLSQALPELNQNIKKGEEFISS